MSRRNRLDSHRNAQPPQGLAPSPSLAGSDLLEKILVGAFATLMIARPLVPGDDPGRLRLTSSGGPLTFNLALFALLMTYLAWRLFDRTKRSGRFDLTPLLLAGVGVVCWISSQQPDRYALPGFYVGWEWLAVAVAYYLTRRLAGSMANSRGLLNVLLASVVSVAGLSIYQGISDRLGLPASEIVLPASHDRLLGDPEFYPELNNPPLSRQSPRGTYDSPETLLGVLLLAWPVVMVVALAGAAGKQKWLAQLLPIALALSMVSILFFRPFQSQGGWVAALKMLEHNPALGVGPGNFSRASQGISSHSGWFGLAATIGFVGFIGFILAWFPAILELRRPARGTYPEEVSQGPRWQFYYAGVLGLLIGLIWSAADELAAEAPSHFMYVLGAKAIGRGILWFATFALLESIRPPAAALSRALLLGAGIVLCYGLFSDSLRNPCLLVPLWVTIALAVNFRSPSQVEEGADRKPWRAVSVLAAAGLTITYLITAAIPGWSTSANIRHARMSSRFYLETERQLDLSTPGPERANSLTKARSFLLRNLLKPLKDAVEREPNNAVLRLELARWRRSLWMLELVADPKEASQVADRLRIDTETANHFDPQNPAAKRSFLEALFLFLKNSSVLEPERITSINKLIGQLAERDPEQEVPLRYRFVQILLERTRTEALETELAKLLRLNRQEGHGHLTPTQKSDLIEAAKKVVTKPPKELLDEWIAD
jgi:hypothetical protein